MPAIVRKINQYKSLVKFSHTVFALPFAMIGFFYGVSQSDEFSIYSLLYVVACMVFARNSAMAFNRYIDRKIDERNPRTASREIPAGVITPSNALLFIVTNVVLFMGCCFLINPLAFALSPVALLVVLGYSLTKRFTPLCHLVLGLGLAIAPVGAYIAVTGGFATAPVLLAVLVLTWVSAFDILYALQDEQFDRDNGLFSIPMFLGLRRAIAVSILLHVLTAVMIVVLWWYLPVSGWYWVGAVLFMGLLVYQHIVVRPSDISKVDIAFATLNGCGSLVYGGFTILSLYV